MKDKGKLKKVLTIAGSDSGGGAGIQADLKTFFARGVYGMSVITAVTAQNTVGVQGIFELPAEFVGKQIDSVMEDITTDAVKIGMLSNKDVINVIAKKINEYAIENIVLDPVMVAKSGDNLFQEKAKETLIAKLFPLLDLVTPNLYEAEVITGLPVKDIQQMKVAANVIFSMGPKNVLIKGGHLSEDIYATDILFDGQNFVEYSATRIVTQNTHGTGCTYSSAITAELAKGFDIQTAVANAKKYVTAAIKSATHHVIGKGHGPLDHMVESE
jgi:hydroxymethylpyrimidine/phosphomethylpyrimidine kinase